MDTWRIIIKHTITLLLFLNVATCYNTDVDYPVKKQGQSGTYFGFSVAQHQVSVSGQIENWMLVAAPRSNSSGLKTVKEPGAVFKCNATNGTNSCQDEVLFDKRGNSAYENKDNQWFGVSLKSHGKSVLACAHRAMYYTTASNYHLLEGRCRSMNKDLLSSGNNFKPCRSNIGKVLDQVPSYLNYGQCQSGIGIDIIEGSQTNFLFGTVGVKNFIGAVFQQDSEEDNPMIESEKIQAMNLSYFGYSVTHGNFLSKTRKDVATGGPRSNSTGKVLIYQATKLTRILTLPHKQDEVQLASAFGFAVCSYNIKKNEGYSYLLVGAPFHENEATEQGMVYVYLRSGERNMQLVKKLTVNKQRANFGSAIVSAGDLDLDGINDFIVGAPYEDDFAGAIYIYHGTLKGPSNTYSQRVSASKLDTKLRALGRSLAAGIDMDGNGYGDILAGAYLSDQAVLLRSRPIIKIISSVTTNPAKINPDNYMTDRDRFQINVTFRYEERSKRLKSVIVASLKLTVDADRTARIKFSNVDKNVNTRRIGLKPFDSFEIFTAYLVRDNGKFQSYPDVTIDMDFSLVQTTPTVQPDEVKSLDDRPVLASSSGSFVDHQLFDSSFIEFKRDCDPCIPDLSVVAKKNITMRLGRLDHDLSAKIINSAKATAFQTDFSLILPPGINVILIKFSKGGVRTCNDPVPYMGGNTMTLCKNLFDEIKPKTTEDIVIVLNTQKLDANVAHKRLTLNVSSANKEVGTEADNSAVIDFEIIAEADLDIQGTAITNREYYGGNIRGETVMKKESDIGHALAHRYYVENKGPDVIASAVVTIHWPVETLSGKHLLYLMAIESKGLTCTIESGKVNELRIKSSNISVVVGKLVSGERRRRDIATPADALATATTATTANLTAPVPGAITGKCDQKSDSEGKAKVLDCFTNTAKCAKIVCKKTKFESQQGFSIVIKSRIWNSTLLMDYNGEDICVRSRASVAIGVNASYIKDPNPNNNKASVSTRLKPEIPKKAIERVEVWKIVLAVIAGIILLALLIFGLYKLGFFKRQDKSSWKKKRRAAAKEKEKTELLEKKEAKEARKESEKE